MKTFQPVVKWSGSKRSQAKDIISIQRQLTNRHKILQMTLIEEQMNNKEEYKDKCTDCPFNGTSCPGGAWCTEED